MAGARPGQAAFDRWTVAHVVSGLALGLVGVPWWAAVAIVAGFEVIEAGLRRIPGRGGGLFEWESWPNIFADMGVAMLAWPLGRWLGGVV